MAEERGEESGEEGSTLGLASSVLPPATIGNGHTWRECRHQ